LRPRPPSDGKSRPLKFGGSAFFALGGGHTESNGRGAPTDQGGKARRPGARQLRAPPQRPKPWLGGGSGGRLPPPPLQQIFQHLTFPSRESWSVPPRLWVAPRFAPVPDPLPGVFLVSEYPVHGCGRPPAFRSPSTLDTFQIQALHDARFGLPLSESLEDAQDDGRLAGSTVFL
jgi:hypothetical protein